MAIGDVNKELETIAEKYILDDMEGDADAVERLHSVNFDELGDEFAENISKSIKEFIGQSSVYILKDMILAEDMLDDVQSIDYDSIVELASKSLIRNFDAFVSACVNLEAENLIKKVKNEVTRDD